MKYLIIILNFIFVTNVYAEKTITVILTDEEYRAMSILAETPEEWIQHSAINKAQKMIDILVKENSNLQPDKASESEKKEIIKNIDIDKERKKRHGK